MDIGKDYYLHYWAQKLIMTFPQFLSSSSNTVAQKSPKTEHVSMMWRVYHVCKKYFSLDCAMQCPRWPGVINDRDYCDTVSAACCSYLEFVFSVWCLVQISGLEGGGRGGAADNIMYTSHNTQHCRAEWYLDNRTCAWSRHKQLRWGEQSQETGNHDSNHEQNI